MICALGLTLGVGLTAWAAPASAATTVPANGTLTGHSVGGIRPASASGCNQETCIYVNGTGNYVNFVTQTGFSTDGSGCVYGEFLVRGQVRAFTNTWCWSGGPQQLTGYYTIHYNIATGSQVCVDFVGLGAPLGKPCETIE